MDSEDCFTIPEFCRRHKFSQSYFFVLKKTGLGPRTMKLGHRTLISKEAAAAWRREREAESAQPRIPEAV
jgi:hypothetical protein